MPQYSSSATPLLRICESRLIDQGALSRARRLELAATTGPAVSQYERPIQPVSQRGGNA